MKFIQFKIIIIVFIHTYILLYSVIIFLLMYPGCQSVLIYFHNILLLVEIVFHVGLWHFRIITFHQVLELFFSFGLHCLLMSKANLFQLFGQSRMQKF